MQISIVETLVAGGMGLSGALIGAFFGYLGARTQARSTNENPLIVEKLRVYANLSREISILVGEDTEPWGGDDKKIFIGTDLVGQGGHTFKFQTLDGEDHSPITVQGDVFIRSRFSTINLLAIEAEFLASENLRRKFNVLRACVKLVMAVDEEPYLFEKYSADMLRLARVRFRMESEKNGWSKEEIIAKVNDPSWIEEQEKKISEISPKMGKINIIIENLKPLKEIWLELKGLMLDDIAG